MTWNARTVLYQDRRISYLGEYCGIDTIRSSGLHSFLRRLIKSNLDPDQFFPGFFYSTLWMKNEGRRMLSYLSRNISSMFNLFNIPWISRNTLPYFILFHDSIHFLLFYVSIYFLLCYATFVSFHSYPTVIHFTKNFILRWICFNI